MNNVAKYSENDKRILFRNTAAKMGLNDAIVEKDFWVCITLDYLFNRSPWKNSFSFKGGTSLSKAFNLISRFSEDIDLILDWRVLGYGVDEPWEKRSKTKRDAFNKEANLRTETFIEDVFFPLLRKGSLGNSDLMSASTLTSKNPRQLCLLIQSFLMSLD